MAETSFPFPCGSSVGALVCVAGKAAVQCLLAGQCSLERWAQLMLDPFDFWFSSLFGGRPKTGVHSATDSVALFLIASANPIIKLWGVGIRQLEAAGCQLAGGGPCRVAFERLASAAQHDLMLQFPTIGAKLFSQYAYLASLSNPSRNRVAIAARQVVDKHYTDAVRAGELDPTTGFKPRCPGGTHYDVRSERCVRDTQVCPPGFVGTPPLCKPIMFKPVPPPRSPGCCR